MRGEGWLPRRALTKACAPPGWGALAGRRAIERRWGRPVSHDAGRPISLMFSLGAFKSVPPDLLSLHN